MKAEFKSGLAEALEVEKAVLEPGYVLEESEMWDSMTVVTVIALIDEHYSKMVEGERLAKCQTVADIDALIGNS